VPSPTAVESLRGPIADTLAPYPRAAPNSSPPASAVERSVAKHLASTQITEHLEPYTVDQHTTPCPLCTIAAGTPHWAAC